MKLKDNEPNLINKRIETIIYSPWKKEITYSIDSSFIQKEKPEDGSRGDKLLGEGSSEFSFSRKKPKDGRGRLSFCFGNEEKPRDGSRGGAQH